MVRLKGKKVDKIRINLAISIPYGAIKSANVSALLILSPEFQFLMVRLKETLK